MTLELTVCMGSSCFSKGSDKIVEIAEKYKNDKDLNLDIDLKGCLCTNSCNDGPIVILNGEKYTHVDENIIVDILKKNIDTTKTENK